MSTKHGFGSRILLPTALQRDSGLMRAQHQQLSSIRTNQRPVLVTAAMPGPASQWAQAGDAPRPQASPARGRQLVQHGIGR